MSVWLVSRWTAATLLLLCFDLCSARIRLYSQKSCCRLVSCCFCVFYFWHIIIYRAVCECCNMFWYIFLCFRRNFLDLKCKFIRCRFKHLQIKAELYHFNHIFTVRFESRCAAVAWYFQTALYMSRKSSERCHDSILSPPFVLCVHLLTSAESISPIPTLPL